MASPIPGIEGFHSWGGGVTLNDKDVFPRYKLHRINGLRSKPESENNVEATPGRMGEIHYPSLLRGKTVTYEGDIEALTLDSLRRAESDLLDSFAPNDTQQMILTFHPLYPYGSGLSYFYEARSLQCEVPDEQIAGAFSNPTPFKRPFTVALRLADPRIYQNPGVGPFSTSAATSTSGIVPPFTPPITIAGDTLGGAVTVSNLGNAETDPVFELHGPVINPYIINQNLDKALYFITQLDTVDDFITVDFKTRKVLLQGTTQRPDLLDLATSTWWDAGVPGLPPGTSTILYRGTGIGVPEMSDLALAELSFYHANF